MTGSTSKRLARLRQHNQWLLLIAVFKFAQAFLFIAVGVGARRLLHKDVADELNTLADRLHFNSDWRFVEFILDRATVLNDPMLRRIGIVAFCYASLEIAEGIGLYLEKAWGEFLTLFITASFLPWEIHELIRRITWPRVSLFIINILVFVYLLKLVVERGRHKNSGTRAH
jgi:uncharacterized membrane protein (DUF2068 family)